METKITGRKGGEEFFGLKTPCSPFLLPSLFLLAIGTPDRRIES
jgi:hypothetical protein